MTRITGQILTFMLCAQAAACVSYSSIQKVDDKIYLSGAKSFWFVSIAFLKRCDLEGQVLKCEELKELEPAPANDAGASSGPGAGTDDSATPPADGTTPPADSKAPAPTDKKPTR